MPVHQRPASSSALVPQDPYTLTPSEQARYEQIFPEYAKGDGYVYGPEAVALFSKSGVPQPVLAAIWNLVDVPVDNRLDKLEFAMAMHLIVCVGKKGMPLPGGLPMSLKHLKSQQGEMMQQHQQQGPAHMQQQQPPPSQMQQQQQQPNQPMQRQMMQPPPSPAMSSASHSLMRAPSPMMMQQQQQPPSSPSREMPAPSQMPPSSSFSSLQGPPQLTKPQTLDIHDAFEGLTPQAVPASTYMQQTQPTRGATSFSLDNSDHESRYTQDPSNEMGYYNSNERAKTPEPEPAPEPPKSTKELKQNYNMGAASEELVKLKTILQKLQAENISLKASMQHLNEEEKEVQKELVATVAEISKLSNELTTLRAKVLASKSRLLEATSELKAAKVKKGVIADLIAEASATRDAIDEAYKGIENANQTVHEVMTPPAPAAFEGDLFGFDQAPAPNPAAAAAQNSGENQPRVADTAAPSFASSEDHYSSDGPPQYQHQAPAQAPAAPAYQQESYGSAGGHNRSSSVASAFDGMMGGEPVALPKETPQQPTFIYNAQSNVAPAPSLQNIEEMKRKLKEAEDVARDSADSAAQVRARANELKQEADEAEARLEAHNKQFEGKKKGLFGGGGKKAAKEAERLAEEAKEKKDKFTEIKKQLKETDKCAKDARKEADNLRKEVEDAELKLATASSMEEQPPPGPKTNGFSPPNGPAYGGSAYGMNTTSSSSVGGFDEPLGGQIGSGFNPSVMAAGGGIDIPMPEPISAGSDPYSNPFH